MLTRAARIFRGEKRRAPPAADIARFLELSDQLVRFEAQQRMLRGYGAFDPDTQLPDPAFVRVSHWLRLLAGEAK